MRRQESTQPIPKFDAAVDALNAREQTLGRSGLCPVTQTCVGRGYGELAEDEQFT